jgi:mercuric ion transport protein
VADASIVETAPPGPDAAAPDKRERWFAAGGLTAAVLASSCCVAPLVLLMLGVSGAWIGNLTALEPYKPVFAAVALLFIGLGFWQVYFRRRRECAERTYCAQPRSSMITKVALWVATALTIVALTTDWWAPLFY